MNIKLHSKLTKTMTHPEIDITNARGRSIQMLDDGRHLILFNDLYVTNRRKIEQLQWYVHEQDFHLDF